MEQMFDDNAVVGLYHCLEETGTCLRVVVAKVGYQCPRGTQSGLHLGLPRFEVITSNEHVVLFGEIGERECSWEGR